MTLLGPRRHDDELLDARGQEPGELGRSLRHVSAVNRWLGGDRSVRRHLLPLLRDGRAPLRVLDVGVGDGGLLRRLAKDAGPSVGFVGVDIHPDIPRIARERSRDVAGLHLVRADGLRLPFADDAFTAVVCSLTLHHFRDGDARRLLDEMGRVGRVGVVVSDLERCVPNYAGARLLSWTLWRRNRLTRNDGPLSVLRSFTPDELRRLARETKLRKPRVRRHFPFRLVLEARPPSPTGATPDES